MPRGINKVLLIGLVGRDPEMRYTPEGKPVTTFSLAVSRPVTSDGGDRREATEWFNIVAWRRLAEICRSHLATGSRVYIEGRLQTRSFDDAAGNRQQRVEVVAHEMLLLDGGHRDAFVGEEATRVRAAHDTGLAPTDGITEYESHPYPQDEKGEERHG